MKKILLPILASTLLFAGCSTKKKDSLDTENRIVFTDTTAAKNGNASNDVGTKDTTPIVVANKPIVQPKVQVKTITKVVKVYEKQPTPKVIKTEAPPVIVATTPSTTTTTGTNSAINRRPSMATPVKIKISANVVRSFRFSLERKCRPCWMNWKKKGM